MAKKKAKIKRRYIPKKKHRRKSRKIPILPLITAGAIPFVPAEHGWGSPINDAKRGDYVGVAQNLLYGFQPFFKAHLKTGEVMFNLHIPRYLAMLIGASVASRVASAFGANKIFQNLPSPINKLKW